MKNEHILKVCQIYKIISISILSDKSLNTIFTKDIQQIEEFCESIIMFNSIDINQYTCLFNCIDKQGQIYEANLSNQLQQQFINQLQMFRIDNLKEILDFFSINNIEFEETYSCVIIQGFMGYKSYNIVCTKQRYQYVELLIDKYKLSSSKYSNILLEIVQNNPIILTSVRNMLLTKQIYYSPNIKFTVQNDRITLCGTQDEVQSLEQSIQNNFSSLQSKYINKNLKLKELQIKYFCKYLSKEKIQIENKENCLMHLDQQRKITSQILFTLAFQSKKLNLVYADIQNFETEAVVNFCNSQIDRSGDIQSKEISSKIAELGDNMYDHASRTYVWQHDDELPYGVVFAHFQKDQQVQHILHVSTPLLKQTSSSDDLMVIRQNIQAILEAADQRKIKEITIPLIYEGQYYQSVSQFNSTIITHIILALQDANTHIQTVNLIDTDIHRLNSAINNVEQVIQTKPKRQVKYQWQWEDSNYQNYDPEINEQIDVAYEKFKTNKQLNEIQLVFPFIKTPGTHVVDFYKKQLIDKDLKNIQPIKLVANQYYFGNQQVPSLLNDYLISQNKAGNQEFEIFYKRYKILFTNNHIIQFNEETNYQRQVQFIRYNQAQHNLQVNAFGGTKYQVQKHTLDETLTYIQHSLRLEMIGTDNFNSIQNKIQSLIQSNLIQMSIKIPQLKDQELRQLMKFIKNTAFQFNQSQVSNKQATITIFKEKRNKILQHLEFVKLHSRQYPEEWNDQSQNFMKVDLPNQHTEFKKVSDLFRETLRYKNIHKIFRIQNQLLWDNYVIEKQKILDLKLQKHIHLDDSESQRYLWHGVSKEHPKAVYNTEKEAFDVTYSNNGMWGTGMYFAENASYSEAYSYKLKHGDEANCAGKQVFLCCLVTTGKIYQCAPDQSIKRPPDGFDCVSGYTNGSDVYVLYQMDVRRAYPAYEVIFS